MGRRLDDCRAGTVALPNVLNNARETERELTLWQVLFIFLNACCMIGAKTGVGHKMLDFTSIKTIEKAMLVRASIPSSFVFLKAFL